MTRLRILTFNVQNDSGDARRIELINRQLRRLDPDLVALQEVTGPRQVDELLAGSGLHGTHQSAVLSYVPEFADRYGGSALASRWPHEIVEVLDHRGPDATGPWLPMAAMAAVPDIGNLLFIAVTLEWRLDAEAARERQIRQLTDLDGRHRTELPTILAGDFNAGPQTSTIRYMTGRQALAGHSVHYHDAWEIAGDGPGHTWTVDNPLGAEEIRQVVGQPGHRRRIDYIFTGSWHAHPRARCEIRSAELVGNHPVDGVWLSDHYGVVVDVDVTKTGG